MVSRIRAHTGAPGEGAGGPGGRGGRAVAAVADPRAAPNGPPSGPYRRVMASRLTSSLYDMCTLFSSLVRVPLWELPATASAYERLDRSDFAADHGVRETVDAWYRRLPEHSRADIRHRFTSRRLGDHLGAFWEMYPTSAPLALGSTSTSTWDATTLPGDLTCC